MRSSPIAYVTRLLAMLILVTGLAAACNSDKKAAQSATTTAPAIPPATTGPKKVGKLPPGGRLLLGTRNLYPILSGRLASFAPGQVTGEGVPILTVVSPTAIWVGKNKQQRLLVTLRLKGEGGPKLKAGQKATFVGALFPSNGKEDSFGLKNADRLKVIGQGVYLDVSAADFRTK